MPASCTGQKDSLFALLSYVKCLMQGLAQGNANMRAQAQKDQNIPSLLQSERKGVAFREETDLPGGHHQLPVQDLNKSVLHMPLALHASSSGS